MKTKVVMRSPLFWALQVAQFGVGCAILQGNIGVLSIAAGVSVAGTALFATPFLLLAIAITAATEIAWGLTVPFLAIALSGSAVTLMTRLSPSGPGYVGYAPTSLILIVFVPAIWAAGVGGLAPNLPGPATTGIAWIFGTVLIVPFLITSKGDRADVAAGAGALAVGLAAGVFLSINAALAALALVALFCALLFCLPRLTKPLVLIGMAGFGVGLTIWSPAAIVSPVVMAAIALVGVTYLVLLERLQTHQATITDLEDRIARRTQRIRYLLNERDEVTTLAVHDLQSPIQAISGMQKTLLHMINQGQTDATIMRPALEAAIATNSDLSDRIGSILSTGRDHLGGGDGPSELSDIVKEVTAAQTLPAKDRGLSIHAMIDQGLHVLNQEDIKDVLDVLLDNAIRFSPTSGSIAFRCLPSESPSHVLLEISDQGPGVPDTLIPALFSEPRAKANPAGRQGIGLYLAYRRIKKLGGDLTYQDAHPSGACFCIRLPVVSQ